MSISLSKWPMLQTIALSFNASKCSPLMISLFPVVVITMSAFPITEAIFFTSKPSIAACNAQIGSISVTVTIEPAPLNDAAVPFPTSPYPATTTLLPASMVSVARLMASTADSLQPYLLSNLDLVTESFTFMAGIGKVPFLTRSYNLCTPVVVSSDKPLMAAAKSGYWSSTILVKSPPSSKIIFSGSRDSPKKRVCSIHQSNSSSFIPFQA